MGKKRSKRANGEGSIFPLKNGKWRAIVTIGWTADGKRMRRSRTADSHADASVFLREMQAEADRGFKPTTKTLGDYLQNWLLGVESSQEENTSASYRTACEKHVIPLIGHTRLLDLKPAAVRWLFSELAKKKVGGRAAENAFVVLRLALDAAVSEGEIQANPCHSVKKPKHDPKEIFPFTHEEAKAILKATESHRLYALFVLAFATGLRSAELFGLEWQDFDGKTIHVQRQATSISGRVVVKSPKSEAGKRRIELSPGTIRALEDRRALAMAKGQAACDLIFPNRRGNYIQRGVFRSRVWNMLFEEFQPKLAEGETRQKTFLPFAHRGFHHVRHTYACLALADGVPLPTVSYILGHSKQTTTLLYYSRFLPGHQSAATDSVTRLFG